MKTNPNVLLPTYQRWSPSPRFSQGAHQRAVGSAHATATEHVVWSTSLSDSYAKGAPSGSSDHMPAVNKSFTVPFISDPATSQPVNAQCSMSLGVEDWGSMTVGNQQIDLMHGEPGKQGGHAYWDDSIDHFELEAGRHLIHVEHINIDYQPPSGNISTCHYSFEATISKKGDPTPGGTDPPPCDPCEKKDGKGGAGYPPTLRSRRLGASPGLGSSAGQNVHCVTDASRMYWKADFGSFLGMGGIPNGSIELMAEESIDGLEKPSALCYHALLASVVDVPEGGIVAGAKFDLVVGAERTCFECAPDGVSLDLVGVFTATGSRASLVEQEGVKCVQWVKTDKSVACYDATTGLLLSYKTSTGKLYTAEEIKDYQKVKTDSLGGLRQIWNLWDGVLNIESVTESGYTIALYTAAQVRGQDAEGFYMVEGAPFKKFVIAKDSVGKEISLTEQTPLRPDFITRWWQTDKAWNMAQGSEEDAITTKRVRTDVEADIWQLVTSISQGIDGVPVSCLCEVYQTTAYGNLLLSKVEGYGSPLARTTTYEYDYFGKLKKETAPDGSVREWAYDMLNRVILERSPWSGGKSQDMTYEYVNDDQGSELSDEIAVERCIMQLNNHQPMELWKKTSTYEESNHIKRVTTTSTALEMSTSQVEITEEWLGSAPNPHARGRIKMTQGVDGVQTHYEYAPTTQYGALYTETQETRVNGLAVPNQSSREVQYITPEGNVLRTESYVFLDNRTWALTESAAYEFDVQNRWMMKTRGNGHVSERNSMCDGRLLWTKDEDGIVTSYAYNAARQLIETIRSETASTPESITSYTRDALNRVITTRRDIGAMSSTVTNSYDILGRMSSSIDELGRETKYSYSGDGLRSTQTLPTGATLITQHHADGSILRQHGSGQADTKYELSMEREGINRTSSVPSGNNWVATACTVTDGFGQEIRIGTANTQNDWIFLHRAYNEQGKVVREQKADRAPTLFSYDSFGNLTQEVLALAEVPSVMNSRIVDYAYRKEAKADGIYQSIQTTHYNEEGDPIIQTESVLISALSTSLESKSIQRDPRQQESITWTEYSGASVREQKQSIPAVEAIAITRIVDGLMTTQQDFAGIGSSQSRRFTATGMILEQCDARGNTTTRISDIVGRLLSETDAAGNSTRYSYDPKLDQPSCITNAQGKTTCYAYDIRGRKTAEWGTAIQPCVYTYDDAGHLLTMKSFRVGSEEIMSDPRSRSDGDITRWAYHLATGLLTRKSYADGSHIDTSYTNLNQVATVTNARGIIATHSYAPKTGELTGSTYSDGTAPLSVNYNHLGQLKQISDASGTRNICYNSYGEAVGENTSGLISSHLTTKLDSYGREIGYSLQDGDKEIQDARWDYDLAGRLSSLALNAPEVPAFQYQYNTSNGLLDTLIYPNAMERRVVREEKRNLATKISYWRSGSANDPAKVEYSYDSLARPTTKKEYFNTSSPGLIHSYSYNDRSELIADALSQGDNYAYTYDNIGNRKTAQEATAEQTLYTSTALNQYSSIAHGSQTPFSPSYDADGNQTTIKTSSGEWTVSYNALNQATRFTQGSKRIECVYDYRNRRVEKAVYEGDSLSTRTRFIYRGYLQIAELDASTATESLPAILRKTYLWDPSESTATRILALTTYDATGTYEAELYYTHDAQKNTTALFGIQAGRRASYQYSAYGSLLKIDGDLAALNPFRFSSEYHDDGLDLIYYNYRYYNPTDGRWIHRDPIEEQGGVNLYGFVNNDPVVNIDYKGLRFKIKLDKINCIINIVMDIVFYPLDDTAKKQLQDVAQKAKKNIEDNWNGFKKGCCLIKVTANIITKDKNNSWLYRLWYNSQNYIGITFTENTLFNNSNRSFVQGGKTGKWWGPAASNNTFAHEAGHLLNLGDKYTEKILGKPKVNPEDIGDMMADNGKVQIDEIEKVVEGIQCPCKEKSNE